LRLLPTPPAEAPALLVLAALVVSPLVETEDSPGLRLFITL
jgi:hypothetical protein